MAPVKNVEVKCPFCGKQQPYGMNITDTAQLQPRGVFQLNMTCINPTCGRVFVVVNHEGVIVTSG